MAMVPLRLVASTARCHFPMRVGGALVSVAIKHIRIPIWVGRQAAAASPMSSSALVHGAKAAPSKILLFITTPNAIRGAYYHVEADPSWKLLTFKYALKSVLPMADYVPESDITLKRRVLTFAEPLLEPLGFDDDVSVAEAGIKNGDRLVAVVAKQPEYSE
jgi:hypothetical protein